MKLVQEVQTLLNEADDEVFTFGAYAFDIDKAEKLLKNQKPKKEKVTKEWRMPFVTVDKDHIDTADLSRPVIFAEVVMGDNFGKMMIDGNHRVEKALKDGVKELPTLTLPIEDTLKILLGRMKTKMKKEAKALGKI